MDVDADALGAERAEDFAAIDPRGDLRDVEMKAVVAPARRASGVRSSNAAKPRS